MNVQVLQIRKRVKWALARHYLTLGVYSKFESGGKLGVMRAVRERLRPGHTDADVADDAQVQPNTVWTRCKQSACQHKTH